jgi:hypothetical protein
MGGKRNVCRNVVVKPEGKYHQEDLDVGGRIILKWILERYGGMTWIDLAQNDDQSRAHVNKVMNLPVP